MNNTHHRHYNTRRMDTRRMMTMGWQVVKKNVKMFVQHPFNSCGVYLVRQ